MRFDARLKGGQDPQDAGGATEAWVPPSSAADYTLAGVTRRPKQGFAIPVARWLRSDLRPVADEVFLDPASPLRDWCRPEALAGLWRQHLSGAADARKELWALMTLGLWLRYHCGPGGAGAPTP